MKNNSTKVQPVRKPRSDFPLFPHKTGRWAKKARGKFVFSGSTLTGPKWEAALNLWLDQKDELLAGRQPRVHRGDGFTIRDLCNRFLTAKKQQLDIGEIANRPLVRLPRRLRRGRVDARRGTNKRIDRSSETTLITLPIAAEFYGLRTRRGSGICEAVKDPAVAVPSKVALAFSRNIYSPIQHCNCSGDFGFVGRATENLKQVRKALFFADISTLWASRAVFTLSILCVIFHIIARIL